MSFAFMVLGHHLSGINTGYSVVASPIVVTSNTISVGATSLITKTPVFVSIKVNQSSTSGGTPPYTYAWQYSADGGVTWNTATNNAPWQVGVNDLGKSNGVTNGAWLLHGGYSPVQKTDGTYTTATPMPGTSFTSTVNPNLTYTYKVTATDSLGATGSATSAAIVIPFWESPATISTGGTYSGHSWRSTDNAQVTLSITATSAVIIQNCYIQSMGDMIFMDDNTNLTIQDSYLYCPLNPAGGVSGEAPGLYVDGTSGITSNLVVQYCSMASGWGLKILDHSGSGSFVVQNNLMYNTDGRVGAGSGTWTGDNGGAHPIQISNVTGLAGVVFAWNQIISYPNQSSFEDNISIYQSTGTTGSYIQIHDNYIQGGYYTDVTGAAYTGGGIMLGDDTGTTGPSTYVNCYNNQIVNNQNYGIAMKWNSYTTASNNRCINSNLEWPNGVVMYDYFGNGFNADVNPCPNCSFTNNTVRWMRQISQGSQTLARSDDNNSVGVTESGNTYTPSGAVTFADELAEWTSWLAKVKTNSVQIGPRV